MSHSVETVFSMEDTDSSDYLSSCDSVYSLDSASSVEDDYEDFDVFLSDGCEEDDKKTMDVKDRQAGDSEMEGPVLSPEAQRVPSRKSSLKCLNHQYRTLRTGLQSVASLQTPAPCSRHPFLLANRSSLSNHSWALDKNNNAQIKTSRQNREEAALKQSVNPAIQRDRQEHMVPRSPGTKRPRERAQEGSWTTVGLSRSQEPARTDGDRIFAQKCKDLQGFIKPLMGLLNGLKRGRFERGLSTFQQSVAMDRIQRIIGVLQKPEMGERYLGTLLQVEMMLKVWFPSVEMKSSSNNPECVEEEPEHKHGKVENHNASELKGTPRPHAQRFPHFTNSLRRHSSCKARLATPPNETGCKPNIASKDSPQVSADWPAMNFTWMHSSPIANPPHGQVDTGHLNAPFGQNQYGANLNSCGYILFLHNSSLTVPTYPRSASSSPNKNLSAFSHLKEYSLHTGDLPRSLSAPSTSSTDSDQGLELDRGHLSSHSQLPMPSNKSETLNPWAWNVATDLKAKERFVFSS